MGVTFPCTFSGARPVGSHSDHSTWCVLTAEERTVNPTLTFARVPILDKRFSPLHTNPFLLRILASGKLNFISSAVPLLGVTITVFQKEKGPGNSL